MPEANSPLEPEAGRPNIDMPELIAPLAPGAALPKLNPPGIGADGAAAPTAEGNPKAPPAPGAACALLENGEENGLDPAALCPKADEMAPNAVDEAGAAGGAIDVPKMDEVLGAAAEGAALGCEGMLDITEEKIDCCGLADWATDANEVGAEVEELEPNPPNMFVPAADG